MSVSAGKAVPSRSNKAPPRGEGIVAPRAKAVASRPDRGAVLTKAVLRSAELLGLSDQELADSIGVSKAFVLRLRSGNATLEDGSMPFKLSALLVRAFFSLNIIAGGDKKFVRAWMKAENSALGGRPIEQIMEVEGLIDVVNYLDTREAPV